MKFQQINYLTDTIMPMVKPNTFKVIMSIARATWGWKKECTQISFNDFQEATGISGRSTLNHAIKDALDSGFVQRYEKGNSFCYLMFGTEIVPTEENERYENGTDNGTEIVPNHSTAKEYKENIKETTTEGDDTSLAAVYTLFQGNIGGLNKIMSDDIAAAYDDYGGQWMLDAITEAVRNGVYKWRYIEAILENWQSNGRQAAHRNGTHNTVKQANDSAGGVYV